MLSSYEADEIYDDGGYAYWDGFSKLSNPYKFDREAHEEWLDGWLDEQWLDYHAEVMC